MFPPPFVVLEAFVKLFCLKMEVWEGRQGPGQRIDHPVRKGEKRMATHWKRIKLLSRQYLRIAVSGSSLLTIIWRRWWFNLRICFFAWNIVMQVMSITLEWRNSILFSLTSIYTSLSAINTWKTPFISSYLAHIISNMSPYLKPATQTWDTYTISWAKTIPTHHLSSDNSLMIFKMECVVIHKAIPGASVFSWISHGSHFTTMQFLCMICIKFIVGLVENDWISVITTV